MRLIINLNIIVREGEYMIRCIPHIHLIKLYDEYYFYDINTNAIVKVPVDVYNYLQALLKCSENDKAQLEELYNNLSDKLKAGIEYITSQGMLLGKNRDMKIRHIESDVLEDLYKNNLSAITLQVTQNCNLRCKYCVYSGSYVNRTHNNKRMSWETAKKAIDFFYAHSTNNNYLTFGFYGGEPLLEFELIKKIVSYVKDLFKGKGKLFTITTNATLLTEEKIKFLAENNFNLVISLDGPANVQNKNRIFADEHKGTFKTVMNNLEKIKDIDSDYFKKVSFNAVIDLNQDVSCSNQFFLSYDLIKGLNVSGNYISNNNRTEKMDINPRYYIDAQYEIFKVFIYYCTDIFHNYKPTLFDSAVKSLKTTMLDRFITSKGVLKEGSPGGQCLPGIQRFFINAYGKMYPCERVNEKSEALSIGDLDNGFDIDKAKKILNVAKVTEDECKNCWCFKICSQCVAIAEKDGQISKDTRLSNCYDTRDAAENQVKNYITLRKYNCNFEKEE